MTWKSIGLFLFPCQISVQSLMSTYSWEGLNLAIKLKKWTCIHTYICTEAMLYLPSNKLREGIINLYYVFKRNNQKKFIIWYCIFCMHGCRAFVYVYEKFKYIFPFCQWPLLGMFGLKKKNQNRTFMAEVAFSYCFCPPCF